MKSEVIDPEALVDYRHIYLYAKGHYKRTDVIEDLRKILAERNALEPEDVAKFVILNVVSKLAFNEIKNDDRFQKLIEEFFTYVPDTDGKTRLYSEDTTLIHVINRMLAILANVSVLDNNKNLILNLGNPDFKILPKKDNR